MKYLLTIISLFILISSSYSQNEIEGKYKVLDIDTLSENYIINAIDIQDSTKILIISFKEDGNCADKILIKEDEVYNLILKNYFEVINVTPTMLEGGFTLKFDNKVIWDSSKKYYPYKALNIKGLCLCKE